MPITSLGYMGESEVGSPKDGKKLELVKILCHFDRGTRWKLSLERSEKSYKSNVTACKVRRHSVKDLSYRRDDKCSWQPAKGDIIYQGQCKPNLLT